MTRLASEARAAGSPQALYEREGRKVTAEVSDALTLERKRVALADAIAQSGTMCPFWVEPERGYDGRQTDRNRLTVSLETGGLLQVRKTAGTWTYGGGGVGRLLLGWGFGGKVSVLGGAEFGGGAMLNPAGSKSSGDFVINYLPAIPVLLRFHDTSWHYDIEAAAVGVFQADNTQPSYGARAGFGFGVAALRTRFFTPWAGLTLAVEHYFPSGGRAAQEFFRGGLRVGASGDP
jgi:hypothetical protein